MTIHWEIGEKETRIVGSALTRYMTLNLVSITHYHECDGVVRIANGVALPIEDVGDSLMSFQYNFGEIDLQLLNRYFLIGKVRAIYTDRGVILALN